MTEFNTIFCGDCLEQLRGMPDGCVDLVVSSPPYNLGKEYEAKRALEVYLEEQTVVLRECHRVLKSTGSIFWQVGAFSERGQLIPLDIRFFPILESFGMQPRNRIMWIRQHGLHARNKFSARHETLIWFTKSDDYKFSLENIRVPQKYQNKKYHKGDKHGEFSCNPDGKNPGDIWAFRNVKHNHEEQTIHPCQFPEDLIARVVLATTDKGDVVYDPYMGAGTVAVVARDEGRQYLGAELDERYYEVCQRRLSGQPNDAGVFANLKCLRDYCENHGESVDNYRFDVQTTLVATGRGKARIFPEEHHIEELDKRLEFEEASFGAKRRNHEEPKDYFSGGKVSAAEKNQMKLFDAGD
jgi:adenine-specific DNA-methyltransferase